MVSRPVAEQAVEETASVPESPRGGRPRDETRERAILAAAIELIAEVGYESMSVESVAVRAGVSKATIYRRWTGKAELVAEAMRSAHSEELTEPADTGSLRSDLLDLAKRMFASMTGADGGLICGLAVAVRADAELGRLMAANKEEHHQMISSMIVSRAKARGELDESAEPPALMEVALGVTLFHLMSGQPLDDQFAGYMVDRILIPLVRS